MPRDNFVLWAATVRNKRFEERLEAAAAGGFSRMSLFPQDVLTYAAGGLTIPDLRAMAEDRGVEISTLDPFTQWLPVWTPPANWSREDWAFADFDERTFLGMAEALGVRSVNLIEVFGYAPPLDAAIGSFAAFCDRATERGLRVHLEAMAVSGINRLATAWEIVRQAGRPNGGLLLDTWHYYLAGAEPEVLESIPSERIFEIQLADAGAQVQGSLMNDLMHHRLPPGEGSLPLGPLMRLLRRIGGLNSVGPELFSDASTCCLLKRRANALAKACGRSFGKQIAQKLGLVRQSLIHPRLMQANLPSLAGNGFFARLFQ